MNKLTFIFSQETLSKRVGSWSETWYNDGTPDETIAASTLWIQRRMGLLSIDCKCVALRVQVIGRRARVFRLTTPGTLGVDVDIPQMAVNCRVESQGGLYAKYFQLRGVPDGNVVQGSFSPINGYLTAFNQWSNALTVGAWRFRVKDSTKPFVDIAGIDEAGIITLKAPLVANAGDSLQLVRCRNISGQNVGGIFYIDTKTDVTHFKLLNWTGGVVREKGKARVSAIDYPVVNGASGRLIEVTTRKVGRPFAPYRGRALRR